MMNNPSLPTDYESLLTLFQSQQSELGHLRQFVEQLLKQIRLSRHQHFGARSETFSIDQLSLLAGAAVDSEKNAAQAQHDQDNDSIVVPAHRRRKGGRKPLPPELSRINMVYELEGEACHCERCQRAMAVISERSSEQMDIITAQIQVLRHIKKTYGCPHCEGQLKTAPMPPQIVPKAIASAGTIAHIVTAKYVDGLPLYPHEGQLRRIGIDLPRSTLAQWMIKVGQAVQPLINLLNDRLNADHYIGMDETTIQVMREAVRKAQSISYIWVRRGGAPDKPIVLYNYDSSRSQDVPVRLLDGFSGYLQVDGYEGYAKVCATDAVTRLGCMAHARRKFDEALKSHRSPVTGGYWVA